VLIKKKDVSPGMKLKCFSERTAFLKVESSVPDLKLIITDLDAQIENQEFWNPDP